ncbi:FtsX-like permease family protein [Paenibacillus polysaccharolyticus]|uniref:FtsX-like permease family protein n=1 Tax=Paenibacillus polysaccharolyticus TaxID=582692 RepID=UPI00203D330E|nr:ABC transporter permease [Paenibacillus polysaccharolyticus]
MLVDSLNQRRRRTVLILLQCIASYFLIMLTMNFTTHAKEIAAGVQHASSTLYKVNDHFFDQQEEDFLARPDHLLTLHHLYTWEKTNPHFKYIIASKQHLSLNVSHLPATFQYGYEAGQETPDAYESLQVNQQFLEHFQVKTYEGRLFHAEDYNLNNTVVPIIVGYEYKDYLQLGQSVNVGYMGIELKCKIVGILEQNSFYNDSYALRYMDRVIILPSLEADDIYAYPETLMLKLLWDKTNGYISSPLSAEAIQDLFTQKSLQLDIEPYTLEGVSRFYLTMWGLEGEQLQQIFTVFSSVIVVSCLFSLSANIAAKLSIRQYAYGVMIASGVNRRSIRLSILLEVLLIHAASLVLASLFSYVIMHRIQFSVLLPFSMILCLLSCIPPWWMIHRLRLSSTIRGGSQ